MNKNDSSLALYLREIGKYPLLTAEQELELGRKIKDDKDEDAKRQLVNSNLRLVVSVAKNFKNKNIPFEDLVSEGNMGLMTAAEKYDYTLGYRFSTCAVPWIKQAIMKSIADGSRTIRIPAHVIQQFNAYKKAIEKLTTELQEEPTYEQIAAEMKIDLEDVMKIVQWRQNTLSLETPLGDEEGNTLEDICPDQQDETPVEYTNKSLRREKILEMFNKLDERTKTIFKLRFGIAEEGDPEIFNEEHTLEEIGDMLNPKITRERVRQIVNKQLNIWRNEFKDGFPC